VDNGRVEITIKAVRVTAGYFHPQLVSGFEHIAGSPKINLQVIDLTRFDVSKFSGVVARPEDTFLH
jgi:hypothetical protein